MQRSRRTTGGGTWTRSWRLSWRHQGARPPTSGRKRRVQPLRVCRCEGGPSHPPMCAVAVGSPQAAGVGAGGGEAAAQEDPGPAGEAGGDGDDSEGGLSEVELNQEADWPAEEVHDFLVASATEVKRPRSKTKKFQVT